MSEGRRLGKERAWIDVLLGWASLSAALGLALLWFFQMLSRRALSCGDSVKSTRFLLPDPALLSLRKEKPRERALGEVGA